MLLYPIVDSGLSAFSLLIVLIRLDLFLYFGADFAFVVVIGNGVVLVF